MSFAPLTAVAPDLWVASRPLPLVVGDVGARMTVARLPSGELWLHSPVALDAAARAELDALGPVRFVVAPNVNHSLFVAPALATYPAARAYAAPGLEKKRKDVAFHGLLDDDSAWPGIASVLCAGMPYVNEVAFHHAPSRTLVLTDLAFNLPPGARNEARLFHWVMGAAGRFGPHRLVRALVKDRQALRRSIDRVLAWDFDRVIVSHGEVLERGGREALAAAFAWLG